MIKHTKLFVVSVLGACLLAGCSGETKHTVNYYNGNELYLNQSVKDGECAVEPEKPTQEEKNFLYWCSDKELQNRYDFTTPVYGDLSLYSLFEYGDAFTDYNPDYLPVNAPFLSDQHFTEGDKDVDIVLESDGVEMKSSIELNQVRLSGGFEDLKVNSVTNEDGKVTVHTSGTVKNAKSYVAFSKCSNEEGIYLTMPFEVNEKLVPSVSISKASYNVDKKGHNVSFNVVTAYQKFVHGDLTPSDYLAKLNDGTLNYFSINNPDKYELSFTGVSDDFTAVGAKIHLKEGDFNEEVINDISSNLKFNVVKEAIEDNTARELGFILNAPQTSSSLTLTPMRKGMFSGNYRIHVVGCRISQAFKDNVLTLLTDPNNINLFISIPDAKVTMRSINFVNDYEFYGKIDIETEENIKVANVSVNQVKIGDIVIDPLYKLFTDEGVTLEVETTPASVGYDPNETGTINQDEGSSYSGVKSYIQSLALDGDKDTTIEDLVFVGTTLGKIAYGVYSGDYMTASDAVGKAFGIDFLRNPSYLMLDRLKEIMDKLNEIEERIEELGEKIDELKKELEEVGQQTALNTFLTAYNIWNSFKSNYYSPMMDEVFNYTTGYYRYYYNLAIASNPDSIGPKESINIYYDKKGNIVYPADNLVYSVDGKIIDKTKTKTIDLPELHHTLAGIRHHKGHSYTTIENDILTDLTSYHAYSDDELSEILHTLTFNAMKQYFSSQETIDKFTNTFKNFCEAITASDIVSSINIPPLECYSILLRTVFNFGFEIEPDLNLVTIKIQSSFYGAKKIFDFVRLINSGDIDVGSYDDLIDKVEEELGTTRYYRSNDANGNAFNFVSNSYITAATNRYGIFFTADWDQDETKKVRIVENNFETKDPESLEDFASVSEEDLSFMKIKVDVYNIIKNTDYSFKGYLSKIGIIPKEVYDKTVGVLTKIDGIVHGDDDVNDLSRISGRDYDEVSFSHLGAEPHVTKNKYNDIDDFYWAREHCYGLKGKIFSFDDWKSFTNVASFTAAHLKNAYGDYDDKPIGVYADGYDVSRYYNDWYDYTAVWSYYTVFKVVPVNP